MRPLFSVVIPTYNRAALLPRAVASVLAQTLGDFELIIVDDGSTDDTPDRVRSFDDPRVVYLPQPNSGVASARNRGIAHASGELITFLDSDDEAAPNWLERFAEIFEEHRVGLASCGSLWMKSDGESRSLLPRVRGPAYEGQSGLFLAGTFAVRLQIVREAGGYVEELTRSENAELALRLVPLCVATGYQVRSVPEVLHRRHRPPGLRAGLPEEDFNALLSAASYILERHGERLSREPKTYAGYAAVAGVNAVRLGRYRRGREYLRAAAKAQPWRLTNQARLALATFGPLARQVWLRSAKTIADAV